MSVCPFPLHCAGGATARPRRTASRSSWVGVATAMAAAALVHKLEQVDSTAGFNIFL